MKFQYAALEARIAQAALIDRAPLAKILQTMAGNARRQKPYDRLLARFDALLAESVERVASRSQALAIRYDELLPIVQKREQILAALEQSQVLVLAGETGSGKTTQLPKLCLELGRGRFGLIGHTQPRRLAARAVAARIAEELASEPGALVGYQVRFDDRLGEQTRVKLMTDGILLAEIQQDPLLLRYDTLIIDEAHERSLNIDFLLGYLKRILPQRPDLKLIITSATIDLERFSRHFDHAPIIEVSGRTYPVEVRYRPLDEQGDEVEDQPSAILAAIRELETQRSGDILVFLAGERDIRETAEFLRKAQLRDTEVLPLYARLSNAEQNRIFHPGGKGRRIVLATNVAETSLTVPGIRYVIDPGFARISRYSVRSKVQRLPIEAVSQASANQRKGRCGRVAEGVCIRLYSEADFLARPAFTDAEILRTNLAAVILQLAAQKLGKLEAFPLIDPPDGRQIRDGEKLLEELGAIEEGRLTRIGHTLARLPVDPRLGRMLIEGERNGALDELLVLTAVLGIQDPRERPLDKQTQADQKHAEDRDEQSDFTSLLNLWRRYETARQELSQSQLRKLCRERFLSFMRMREWRDLHRQLLLAVRALGWKISSQPAGYDAVHRSLLAGLLGQIGMRQDNREYLGARNRQFMIFPGSALGRGKVKWIMAAELTETSRLFARTVARIEPEWVEALAKGLLRRSYAEPHWEKKRAEVVAYEQVSLYGLVIVPRRKVSYGRIDPEEAQQIFVRAALVEGEYQTSAAFYQHNRALLEEVAALEDKSRRRDILIDEDQLYDFYRERLLQGGGEGVMNGATFERWRQCIEKEQPRYLFLDKAYLMRHQASNVTGSHYPDKIHSNGLSLKLNYHFDPCAADDGVTLEVPAVALRRLPRERMEWLVPGMVEEKCIALIKQLPKPLRKQFVPAPDYARAFLATQPDPEQSLLSQLADWLRYKSGVLIPVETWDLDRLEAHLNFNIRVLDSKGKVIGQGRDLQQLVEQYAQDTAGEIDGDDPQRARWQRTVTGWDFGDLPERVELKQAGLSIPAYPALQVEKNTVALRLFDISERAATQHVLGVARLVQKELASELKVLRRDMREFDRVAVQLTGAVTREVLWQDFCDRLISDLLRPKQPIRTSVVYRQAVARVREELPEAARSLFEALAQIASFYPRLSKQLKGSIALNAVSVLNDIRGQLTALYTPGFLYRAQGEWLARYPVWLQGVDYRLQRYGQDLQRQRVASEELQRLWAEYEALCSQVAAQGNDSEALCEYRWLLEEYRISLFAQQLGTRVPVSAKRLHRYRSDKLNQ